MVSTKFLCSLTLHKSLFLNVEINKMFMIDTLAMELNREIVFTCKGLNLSLLKNNLQRILVHVFV